MLTFRNTLVAATVLVTLLLTSFHAHAQTSAAATQTDASLPAAASRPVTVEWVYRVRYGSHDEWWDLFRKYQIAILDRQKQLGYVKDYTVYSPSLHTSEDSRWDYRIIIVRAGGDAPSGQSEGEIAKQLFSDQAAFRKDENRRWELTTNHWDLPIHIVNPNAAE